MRLQAGDARRDTEDQMLQESCPEWVVDIVVNHIVPKFIKLPFYLLPHASSGIKPLRKDKLSASDMLQIRKVIEHVYDKMMVGPPASESGTTTSSTTCNTSNTANSMSSSGQPHQQPDESKRKSPDSDKGGGAEEKVELLCMDQVLDPNMDLRTVKHFIWKGPGDLVLHYRPLKP